MSSLTIEIPPRLLSVSEFEDYEGTYEVGEFDVGPDAYRASTPFSWHVSASNTGGAVLLTGNITGSLETSCSRCLGPATVDIDSDVEGYFIIEGEGEPEEGMEEDEYDTLPDDGKIDLEPLLKAAIIADLPLMPLCKPDCRGLCPTCGANLNEGPCGCDDSQDDDDDSANNPFAVLRNLDLG
jgi:uncharacterized protein